MTPQDTEKMMVKLIGELTEEGHKSTALIIAKAEALRDYDMAIGVATAKLKEQGSPATLVGAKAKAICAEDLMRKILAEEFLKAHYTRIGILQAQLNGYQSVNRHLAVTSG